MPELRMVELNKVILVGRLCADPEFDHTRTGRSLAYLRVAVNRGFKDRSGGWRQESAFVPVTAWADLAEAAVTYLRKGSAVLVEGRLKTSQFSNGNSHPGLEVVAQSIQFLDRRPLDPQQEVQVQEPRQEEPLSR